MSRSPPRLALSERLVNFGLGPFIGRAELLGLGNIFRWLSNLVFGFDGQLGYTGAYGDTKITPFFENFYSRMHLLPEPK